MEHPRDEETEDMLGDIIAKEVMSLHRFSTTPMVWKDRVLKKKVMSMKAPVTQ